MLQKKILLITPTLTTYYTFLRELVDSLISYGWDVHLACNLQHVKGMNSYKEKPKAILHHIPFPRGANPIIHLIASRHLNKLVCEHTFDIVHVHIASTSFTTALAFNKKWPKTISTMQGLIFASPNISFTRKVVFSLVESYVAITLDQTWVLTKCDVSAFRKLGIKDKIYLQKSPGFGCSIDKFLPSGISDSDKTILRKRLHINHGDFVFTFVGRQVYFKGFHLVVRAFLHLSLIYPNLKLLLVGAPDPLHDSGLDLSELQILSSHDSIKSVGWQSNISTFLSISDVNVFPSFREGMPVNVMESLSIGLPVITSNTRGCKDLVTNLHNGLVIDHNNPEELLDAMSLLYNDRVLLNKLSANALSDREFLDRSNWINEQITIYLNLLDKV